MNQDNIDDKSKGYIRSVERALDVLLAFNRNEPQLSFPQICKKVGLPKTTTYRLLITLQKKGFIEQDVTTGKFHPGIQIISINSILLESLEIRTKAYGAMNKLRNDCGETIHLYVKRGNQRMLLEQVEGSFAIKRYAHLGETLPLYCAASGKVLLAYQDDEEIERILKEERIEKYTENTETNLEKIREVIKLIRKQGYCISISEREIGAASVAAPIFDYTGKIVAALAISGIESRFTPERVQQFIDMVIISAGKVSNNLGYKEEQNY